MHPQHQQRVELSGREHTTVDSGDAAVALLATAKDAASAGQLDAAFIATARKQSVREAKNVRYPLNADHGVPLLLVYDANSQNNGYTRMARLPNVSKLTAAQRAELLEKIEFLAKSEQKIITLADQIKQVIKDSGFTMEELLPHLKAPFKVRAARGTAEKKVPESQDGSGNKPESGTTYKDKSWPEPWTASGKRAPKYVIATIKSGKTWASLKQK